MDGKIQEVNSAMDTFKPGQAVWAKMKGYPLWPGKIMYIENILKPKNKMKYQVFFFGTNNYAWVKDSNILPHTEKIISTLNKTKSAIYQAAIVEVTEYYISQKENESSCTTDQDSDEDKPEFELSPNFKICNEDKNEGELIQNNEIIEISSNNEKDTTCEPALTQESYIKNDAKVVDKNEAKEVDKNYTKAVDNVTSVVVKNPPSSEYKKSFLVKKRITKRRINSNVKSHAVSIKNRKLVQFPSRPIIQPRATCEPMNDMKDKNDMKESNSLKLGFIGMGLLKRCVIEKLVSRGHKVSICCEFLESVYEDFKKMGATLAKDPECLIINSDIVFCYVTNSDAVKEVLFSNHGIISGLQKLRSNEFAHYRGYIEMSAIDTDTSITHSEIVTQHGGHYLEVYNILKGNEKENTVYLIAGEYRLYDTIEPFLKEWALKVFYIGVRSGNACVMRTIFNALSGTICTAVAESSVVIDRLNLPKDEFINCIKNGPINCLRVVELAQKMADENFKKDISLKVIEQDLFNAMKLGHKLLQCTPMIGAANALYERARCKQINADMSAVYKILKYY